MLSFKSYLLEKRAHADRNLKRDVAKSLRDYAKDPNVFISMSFLPKLGIHPAQAKKFSTPLGIYSYPLQASAAYYTNGDVETFTTRRLPFRESATYILVFKPKSGSKLLYVSKYTWDDLDRDLRKVHGVNGFRYPLSYLDEITKTKLRSKDTEEKKLRTMVQQIANKTKKVAMSKSKLYGLALELKKIAKYAHDGSGIGKRILQLIDDLSSLDFEPYEPSLAPSVLFWATKIAARDNTTKWNTLFRKTMGYDGVIDDKGQSVIHTNEPVQAVFFAKDSVDLLEIIRNDTSEVVGTITQKEYIDGYLTDYVSTGIAVSKGMIHGAKYIGPDDARKDGRYVIKGVVKRYELTTGDLEVVFGKNRTFTSQRLVNLVMDTNNRIWNGNTNMNKDAERRMFAYALASMLRHASMEPNVIKMFYDFDKAKIDSGEEMDSSALNALIISQWQIIIGYERVPTGMYNRAFEIIEQDGDVFFKMIEKIHKDMKG